MINFCLLFDHLGESFSYKEVQFKTFCLAVKTSYPPAENVNETLAQGCDAYFKNAGRHCVVSENIHTSSTEGIGISWGVGGSVRPKTLKKCVKLYRNFQRGGGS